MKKIFCFVAFAIVFTLPLVNVSAQPTAEKGPDPDVAAVPADPANKEASEPAVVVSGSEDSSSADNILDQKKARAEKKAARKATKETKSAEDDGSVLNSSPVLTLLSLILSVLALAASVVFYILSRKEISHAREAHHRKYELVKEDLYSIEERAANAEAKGNQLSGKMEELAASIQSTQTALSNLEQQTVPVPQTLVVEEENIPKYEPRIYFAVYRKKGIKVDDLSETKEFGVNVSLRTSSEDRSEIHLVDGIGKTQLSNLAESGLIEVVEGNILDYQSIAEVGPGELCLEDDTWMMSRQIKVKLS